MIGRKIQIGIGKETPRGVTATPGFWLRKMNSNLEDKKEYINEDSSMGVIADSVGSDIVREWAEGEIGGRVYDKSFGLILLGALGQVSSALKSGESAVYEHTLTVPETNQHQSLTVEMKDDIEQLAYSLGMIETLKLNLEVGKFFEFTSNLKTKKGASASNTPSYVAENRFIANHGEFKLADDLSSLDGASAVAIRSIELSINKNLEMDEKIGSNEPVDYENTVLEVEGNLELKNSDTTLKDLFRNGTEKALRLSVVNSDVTIGTSSNPGLQIDLPLCNFQEWERDGDNNAILAETIRFKAHYSLDEAMLIRAILTNTQSSY